MKPLHTPIGLHLAQTAKAVGRAFEHALAAAGGSTPTWLVLMSLMRGGHRTQAELADTLGIRGPTLTHHLNGMEADGLIARRRLPENRRVHEVTLTPAGQAMFHHLREAAMAHDARLRRGFDAAEIDGLRALLSRLAANVAGAGPDDPSPSQEDPKP